MNIGKKGPFPIHSSQASDNEYSDDRYSFEKRYRCFEFVIDR